MSNDNKETIRAQRRRRPGPGDTGERERAEAPRRQRPSSQTGMPSSSLGGEPHALLVPVEPRNPIAAQEANHTVAVVRGLTHSVSSQQLLGGGTRGRWQTQTATPRYSGWHRPVCGVRPGHLLHLRRLGDLSSISLPEPSDEYTL